MTKPRALMIFRLAVVIAAIPGCSGTDITVTR